MALTSLLVCADTAALQTLSRSLADLGLSVEHCTDHSAAIARLAQDPFDALVVDCKDEPAAIQILAAARDSQANKTTFAIAVVDGKTDVREVFAQGANFILYKPISTERATNSLRAVRALMRRERRRHTRIPLHAEAAIAYANVENASATLIDLSEEGTAIQCARRLPPSCKVYFQFTLPGQVTVIRLCGEVVWQDSSGRVGIRFAGVPQASRRVLSQWLQASLSCPYDHAESSASAERQDSLRENRTNPLAGFGLLSVSAPDRRTPSRHACRLGADVYRLGSNVPHRCSLSDIGTGGCYIETTAPFPAGTPVKIFVRAQNVKLRAQGVVQAMHPGCGMAVRFNLKTAEEHDQVQQLLLLLSQSQSSEPGVEFESWSD